MKLKRFGWKRPGRDGALQDGEATTKGKEGVRLTRGNKKAVARRQPLVRDLWEPEDQGSSSAEAPPPFTG